MTTRQERRARERELIRAGETVLSRGLASIPKRSDLAALAAVIRRPLVEPSAKDGASRAAATMHAAFEASMKATPPRMTLACGKGCAWCCHTWVAATAPEIFCAAAAVRARGEAFAGSVAEKANRLAGLGIDARLGAKLPCAMLVDGACSIYAARPTVCRKATSTSVADCIDEFEGRALDRDITMSKIHVDHARSCRLALAAALRSTGHSDDAYELGGAVERVLNIERAEERWLSGEDVFAGLQQAPRESAAFETAIGALCADLS